jgi:DnaJ-domain-containing protein 1
MPDSTQQRLKTLRKQVSEIQRRRASCKGDPEMLRDLDEYARDLRNDISRLERR